MYKLRRMIGLTIKNFMNKFTVTYQVTIEKCNYSLRIEDTKNLYLYLKQCGGCMAKIHYICVFVGRKFPLVTSQYSLPQLTSK
jgi:hypothetical protein